MAIEAFQLFAWFWQTVNPALNIRGLVKFYGRRMDNLQM